jgi:Flp pilus assembly CpaF family ATPase
MDIHWHFVRTDADGPSDEVATLCAAIEADSRTAPHAQTVRDLRSRLSERLRVAVGGKFSSGKSTLVNALLGRVVADVVHRPHPA